MQLLGIDAGTSSIKVSVVDGETGQALASAMHPQAEMPVMAQQPGWAEQHPADWWTHTQAAIRQVLKAPGVRAEAIGAIGVAYQMHGLVLVDAAHEVIRPAIIWSDSRAVPYGQAAFEALGESHCLQHLLNSPGNFTAAKLAWVLANEPEPAARIHRMMLPGDYLAMKLTGELGTSYSGLSEGMMWDFAENQMAGFLLDHFQIDRAWIPEAQGCFAERGRLRAEVAQSLGLPAGIPVSYRAGDQPNNAFALGAIHPGEVAATAGTSGVVYGVSDQVAFDQQSRVNPFAHVNHSQAQPSLGILLCINGTGIANHWLQQMLGGLSYPAMNALAAATPVGAAGLTMLPFGNGAERMLVNRELGAHLSQVDFNRHTPGHLVRATHEGIAFAFRYGLEIMQPMGVDASRLRAGEGNLFLSPIFREALATVADLEIDLYATDGAQGAARGAGVGVGYFATYAEALRGLAQTGTVAPQPAQRDAYEAAYQHWRDELIRRWQA
jgi:xylulokinase